MNLEVVNHGDADSGYVEAIHHLIDRERVHALTVGRLRPSDHCQVSPRIVLSSKEETCKQQVSCESEH